MDRFTYDVFVSYNYRDKEFVYVLVKKLEEHGIRVFVDYRDFQTGAPIIKELERAIASSQYVLLVLTPAFVESSWTVFESMFVQMHDPADKQGRILPILVEDCDIPLRLATLTHIDFRQDFEKGMTQLLASLKKPPPSAHIAATQEPARENQAFLNKQILTLITTGLSRTPRQRNNIFFESAVIEEPNLCFVLMPFGPKWSRPLFEKHIVPACTRERFNALRADDIYGVSGIMQQVWLYVNRARLIVADLTTRNPNVFYEVGLAHALGKDVILTTQTMDDVPFDLRAIRCIVYSLELDGPQRFEEDLQKTIRVVIQNTGRTS